MPEQAENSVFWAVVHVQPTRAREKVQVEHVNKMNAPMPEADLPPIARFDAVLVTPSRDRDTPGVFWPDFDQQIHARLRRKDKPACKPPVLASGRLRIVDPPAVFVSMYDNHFGHFVAETVPRLAQSLAECPQDWPLVFSCDPRFRAPHPSAMFRAVMDWLDVPLARLRFCPEATVFRRLHIAAQAEHLGSRVPTSPRYLDLLEARVHAKLPDLPQDGVSFISRAALSPEKGFHAAEVYLAGCLRQLGVQVVFPEELSLPEQMRIYARSKYLIFSEGSALHGRQLIGRRDQHISVLRRRFRSHLAQAQIAPRCASLRYVSCFAGALNVIGPEGRPVQHAMVSLYQPEALLAHFEEIGVPLRKLWNNAVYQHVRDQDVLRWLTRMYDPKIAHWLRPTNGPGHIHEQLEALGLGHLAQQAAAIMDAGSEKNRRHRRADAG